jgi:hypothetical protein
LGCWIKGRGYNNYRHNELFIRAVKIPSDVKVYEDCTNNKCNNYNCDCSKKRIIYKAKKLILGRKYHFKNDAMDIVNLCYLNSPSMTKYILPGLILSNNIDKIKYAIKYIESKQRHFVNKIIDLKPSYIFACFKYMEAISQNKIGFYNDFIENMHFIEPFNNYKIKLCDLIGVCIRFNHRDFIRYLADEYLPNLRPKETNYKFNTKEEAIKLIEDDLLDWLGKEKYDKFKIFMEKYNIGISGSTVLSKMFNNGFKSNDLDLYCGKNEYKNNFTNIANEMKDIFQKNKLKNKPDYNFKGKFKIYDYTYNKRNVQLIYSLNFEKPEDFIFDNFDFNFCKVVYKNNEIMTVLGYDDIGSQIGIIDKAYLNDTEKHMNKTLEVGEYFKINEVSQSIYRMSQTLERLIKYNNRGFNILNVNYLMNTILNFKFKFEHDYEYVYSINN